ncbi:hypothetical protein Hamer_G006948 [Homarus americanus]|uniref:Uncharacterized protein n=1 Tax=Homarus americanus TaxID=6706 RepID=A0A8J5N3T3_HOMAM|nr:hypothetical protein Hamer_G006948 [Homarus americanus]
MNMAFKRRAYFHNLKLTGEATNANAEAAHALPKTSSAEYSGRWLLAQTSHQHRRDWAVL